MTDVVEMGGLPKKKSFAAYNERLACWGLDNADWGKAFGEGVLDPSGGKALRRC